MKFNLQPYFEKVWYWFLTSGVRIVVIVVLTLILLRVATVITHRLSKLLSRKEADVEQEKRAGTLSGVVHWILRVVILTVAAFLLLGELGINLGPVLAAAGVVGLAVGFGAQNLVQDFISGFFLLLEDQIRVGREFNRRIKKKFDELNIEIPFPHRTIYFGQDKQGAAPLVNVNLTKPA